MNPSFHLPLREIVLLMYMWIRQFPSRIICVELGVNKETIVDWRNFCRDICSTWRNQYAQQIGGLTKNFEQWRRQHPQFGRALGGQRVFWQGPSLGSKCRKRIFVYDRNFKKNDVLAYSDLNVY